MSIARDDFDFTRNVYASPTSAWDSATPTEPNRTALWLFFSLNGRITRSQYWSAMVLTILAYLGMIVLAAALGSMKNDIVKIGVFLICMSAYIWAMLAIQVKRWHDRGKSGAWVLIQMIPFLGPLWSFIELGCLPGDVFENDYGPSDWSHIFSRPKQTHR
jgi:uncharacterized membrane protein YhaH (DUF805 family)